MSGLANMPQQRRPGGRRRNRRKLTASCLLLTAIVAGCGDRNRTAFQSSDFQSKSERPRETPMDESMPIDRRLCVMVVGDAAPLEPVRVISAIASLLTDRGIVVSTDAYPDESRLVALIRVVVREGAVWGGIPSREVLLEFQLFDSRRVDALAIGSSTARVAERSPEEAALGAFGKASKQLTNHIVRALAGLPAEFRTAPSDAALPTPGDVTLACLPFHNATDRPDMDGWCKTLASLAAAAYQRSGRYLVKERARLRDLVGEQDVVAVLGGQSDAAKKLGSDLEVSRLLVGEVAYRPDGSLVVTARLVRVENSGVEQVIVVTGSPRQVERLESAFQRRLDRSMLGWIADRIDQVEQSTIAWPKDGLAPR